MAYGLQTFNDSGQIQLSTDLPLFYMVSSGSQSITASNPVNFGWQSSVVDTTTVYELLFLSTSSTQIWVAPPILAPTTKTGISIRYYCATGASGTKTVNWWAFRSFTALTAPSSGYGLNIWNSSGQTAFAPTQPKILKPATKLAVTSIPGDTSTASLTLPSSTTTYGFAQYGILKRYNLFGGGGRDSDGSRGIAIRQSSSTALEYREGGRTGRITADIYDGGIFAVDLTGY